MNIRSLFKKKKNQVLSMSFFSLMALASVAYAEVEKSLRFIPEKVDFGLIKEEDGKVTRKVKAINITQDSTFIISARTSCGCSAAEYPQGIIAPGDTVEVSLTYDPVNRPGKFLKTARFFTGEDRIGNSIKICGTVLPSRENLDKAYPDRAGALRLSTMLINAGEISRKEARPLFIGLYNDSDVPLALEAFSDTDALEAALTPDTIEAYGVATLSLMLKGRKIPDNETEILYRSSLIDKATGDTVVTIPVGAIIPLL